MSSPAVPPGASAQRSAVDTSLLLAVAQRILESGKADGALCLEVFEMIRGPLRADVLFNYEVTAPGQLRLAASAGLTSELQQEAATLQMGSGVCGLAAAQRRALTDDVVHIESDPAAAFLRKVGVRAYACHPLLGRDGHVLGTFSVASRLHAGFAPHEVDFLETVSHFLAMAWDRHQAQDALAQVTQASERRRRLYETILSNTLDLAYVFDLDHRFAYANEILLAMWGRTWDDAIGKTCLELGYPDWHAAMHDREIEQVKATKLPIRGQVPFAGTFGRRIYDYIFVPVLGPDGEVEAVAGTTRDITDLKRAEDRLREQDQRKDEFIATLAHELRNPLAPLRTGIGILGMSPSPEMASRTLTTMERQVGHMVRLIDDLLDVARITTGKMQLQIERVDLRDAVMAGIEVSRPLLDASGLRFAAKLPDEPLPVDGDATRIAQVVSNLLNNAVKYTPANAGKGLVELTVVRDGDEAVITVSDNGSGLTPDMLPDIFDLFTQAGKTSDRAQGGLGIGLALVRRVVEMHGGIVAADSAGLGLGSAFTIRLATATVAGIPGARTPDPRASAPSGLRVLVVDDNADAADSMALLLGLQGHLVEVANDGEQALSKARSFQPQAVLLDIGLPGMDGYTVAGRLRAERETAGALLVALTGWGAADDRRRAQDAGFDHHLTKPADMAALEALLSQRAALG